MLTTISVTFLPSLLALASGVWEKDVKSYRCWWHTKWSQYLTM